MDIVLVAGLWLDGSAWDGVVPGLRQAGHNPVAVTLPGQGAGDDATLEDQVEAVVRAVDEADGPALVVGHSAACTLTWLAADRRPNSVAKVAMIGGFPTTDGQPYAPFFTPVDGRMAFPGWEPFAGPDSDDLTDEQKASIAAGAHAVPEEVTHAEVRYADPARKQVPVVLVCPEYSVEDAKEWFEAGEMPELQGLNQLEYLDIDSGHWPMFSRPDELAALLATLAG